MIPIGSIVGGISILSGLLSPLAKPTQPEEAAEPAAPAPTSASPANAGRPPGASEALRKVLACYDVTEMTPRQYSQMLEELRKTGALTEEELNQLGLVLLDLDAEGADLDEPLDLVKFYTDKLDKLQDRLEEAASDEGGFSGIAPMLSNVQNRLDWMTKFSLVHSAPDAAGINVLT